MEPMGSSPHTRGAREGLSRRIQGSKDHPRIRGEHVGQRQPVVCVEGIIPAYAGSTARPSETLGSDMGSSPHTRGAPGRRR